MKDWKLTEKNKPESYKDVLAYDAENNFWVAWIFPSGEWCGYMGIKKVPMKWSYAPELTEEEKEAIKRFVESEERLEVSTFIDEDTIIAGYGGFDGKFGMGYDFKYPLPNHFIRMIYQTNSWHQYLEKNKN